MESRICHTSYVIDFLDVDFSSDEISRILKLKTDEVLKSVKNDSLNDWEVEFRIVYYNGTNIRVVKNMPSYVNEKYKLINIQIPIPLKSVVKWGVEPKQHISTGKTPVENKNISVLEVDFTSFTNRPDYIVDSIQRSINLCFEEGFSIKGIKVGKLGKIST